MKMSAMKKVRVRLARDSLFEEDVRVAVGGVRLICAVSDLPTELKVR